MKITGSMIAAAYSAARNVLANEISEAEAVQSLTKVGMNAASASIYVRCLRHLVLGEVFSRTISVEAAKYYLSNVRRDYGEGAYVRALRSIEKHIEGYNALGKGRLESLAKLLMELRAGLQVEPSALKLSKLPTVTLLEEAKKSPEKPAVVTRTVLSFVRSRYVAAARLAYAKGICEECKQPAPFKSAASGEPYLEIHHPHRLADGGSDTFENTVALCPNCHRKAHFG